MRCSVGCSFILMLSIVVTLIAAPVAAVAADEAAAASRPIEFSRDVLPILSANCFACHGPDESHRKRELRLDVRDAAVAARESGAAIVPGKPAESELVRRIHHPDPMKRMPHHKSGKTLTESQKKLLERWIAEGAEYAGHWAFESPTRPALPQVQQRDWPINAIDPFIARRLESEGLSPSEPADLRTLIRRVTFDLTGLAPTPAEVEAFVSDKSPNAYEKVVDRLLASPRYGEHMARFWLDAARYGDTHGLHLDNYREMWPYRDWVIAAFNDNMPFDQFTIKQLAGDLLPEPTIDDLIASGFNRAHVTTNEGGSIKDEVYVRNVIDRTDTAATVFMGLTAGCAVCHDHKFDPFTQRDFYSMFAFFNSLDANPMDGNKKDHAPVITVVPPGQREELKKLQQQIAAKRQSLKEQVAAALAAYSEPAQVAEVKPVDPTEVVWIDDTTPDGANLQGNSPWKFITKQEGPVFSGERATTRSAKDLSQHFFTAAKEPLLVSEGDALFAYVYLDPKDPPKQIMLQWNAGQWEHRAYWGENRIPWGKDKTASRQPMGPLPAAGQWVRLEVPAAHVGLGAGAQINGWAFTQFGGTVYWDRAGIVTYGKHATEYDSFEQWLADSRTRKGAGLPKPIADRVNKPADKLNDGDRRVLKEHFVQHVWSAGREQLKPLSDEVDRMQSRIAELNKGGATTLIYRETKQPRAAHLLVRGEYDNKGEQVPRATPGFLPPMADDLPLDRLGFAKWLVSAEHPLTSRVAVNRFWQQLFGTGIVKTAEDFGTQGEFPSHPELLDWLAVEFRESGWDVKRLMKTMVMSATYRQASKVTDALVARDPQNRLLARGPRFRLDAEMLRDQALQVSGLLVTTMGGESVKPPQPDGLWFAVGYTSSNTARFKADSGEKIYRRSVYTFWKRTSPPPQMATFDAPSREECRVRRERTNTPLQALLLMNEQQYVECARRLAERTMTEGGATPQQRAAWMFQLVTARPGEPGDLTVLLEAHRDFLAEFQSQPEQARKLIAIGQSKPDAKLDPAELAAWTMVANIALNLDEVINKN